ncbi:IucA/IucC family protein [Streptomyces sp. CAI-85]|uniref:IucA/IucC family protein n=1 Tax=Streptomyces sp. CAI-85 TaxID=1472662 RepID=UPI001587DD9D|nr:IucA/IucC family siderophore biosynthesis protein [Streptomyces sp. CAI-85]NUV59612.1 IucA/IucC family siderophore biosynthesis protein [Streptomyces sp. CAI-85]
MHRPPTAAEAEVAAELAVVRPGLGPRYTAALPGARAAVLTRLWRALAHEPLPWITERERSAEGLTLRLRDGRRLHGPLSDPYATTAYVDRVRLDEVAYDDPARLTAALGVPHGDGFGVELGHSVASLALSRAGQPEQAGEPDRAGQRDRAEHSAAEVHSKEWPVHDWEWERRVVDGHPYHPNCRSRPGFTVAEELAYGPEHGPVVRLGLLPVPAAECLVSGEWPAELRDGRRLVLPVHPWQAAHVLKRTCEQGLSAHPLMSLRTLALPDGPHVKTALSTRLTSSVRDISVGSVAASAALSAFGEILAARSDGLLHVTRTLGAATADSPDLAAVLRESPAVYGGPGEHVVPVAALATTGLPDSSAWSADFARLCLTVGLRLLELGVALEAHGQNLLVVLSPSGAPLRLVYRDLADIRVGPARLAAAGIPLSDELPARIRTDEVTALRRKLFGSLVCGALAATLGSGARLATALEAAVRDLPPGPDLAALREEPLPVKALTLMRLSPGSPGDQWTNLPNPLNGKTG